MTTSMPTRASEPGEFFRYVVGRIGRKDRWSDQVGRLIAFDLWNDEVLQQLGPRRFVFQSFRFTGGDGIHAVAISARGLSLGTQPSGRFCAQVCALSLWQMSRRGQAHTTQGEGGRNPCRLQCASPVRCSQRRSSIRTDALSADSIGGERQSMTATVCRASRTKI
jgi:hypothetical protein